MAFPPIVHFRSDLRERLMTLGFGPERERFRHSLFIILVNRLVAVAVAAAALSLLGKSLQPGAPLALFAVPSVANVLGSASQYEALKYVSFPLQALAKCAKTVPVMAWGLLLGGRRYDTVDYGCALTVTFGCALFVLTGSIAAPQQLHARDAASAVAAAAAARGGSGGDAGPMAAALAGALAGPSESAGWMAYGLLLLGAFLLFDGLTSTAQDKLFAQYDMHSCSQLLWVSVWSAGISLGLLLAGGQLWPAIFFVVRHPSAMGYILMLSAVSTAVQLFIFYTIQRYGALHFALIMTLRQFLSIILSCLVFSHDLSPWQWIGTALVIGGLMARGMHRGGLERTSAVHRSKTPTAMGGGGAPRRAAAASGAASLLLPLTTIPVIAQLAPEAAAAVAAAAAAAKKDASSIAVDVQAGSLASSLSESGSGGALGARSPHAARGAARRKASESSQVVRLL
ncbi:adenosine 3-phospho 5-phosphosulfate transporter 1 isoform A [Micractinium conductrix]|uniref:Adenosine 3-phospho 5-phosphosulfate transporter 1 isoform A n=1 Tax=Micractinium conductrix TaxID=554055 RepID=A0A2P6V4R6_9CHLO|nr:adenosine 3-phospho 5-phosphosulfate transporter 1 isoform A [Micractinium conductrix]|eukprot:PSC69081.1 adenosine 3-phospho 5-phosphosulfate transporter 1 isoform A [Micractinium conductrix]